MVVPYLTLLDRMDIDLETFGDSTHELKMLSV